MNPMIGPVRDDVVFCLGAVGRRGRGIPTNPANAARALTKAALAKLSLLQRRVIVSAEAMYLGELGVPQRVAALLDRDVPRRRIEIAWLIVVVAIVAVVAVGWAHARYRAVLRGVANPLIVWGTRFPRSTRFPSLEPSTELPISRRTI